MSKWTPCTGGSKYITFFTATKPSPPFAVLVCCCPSSHDRLLSCQLMLAVELRLVIPANAGAADAGHARARLAPGQPRPHSLLDGLQHVRCSVCP